MCQNCLEAITSILLIIFFINVLMLLLMSVICNSGCIPLLIMGISVFYFTKNVFFSSSSHSPLSTQISGDAWGYWSAVSDWKALLCLLNLTFDFYINIDILHKFVRHDPRADVELFASFFLKCTNLGVFHTISCRPVQTRNTLLTGVYVRA